MLVKHRPHSTQPTKSQFLPGARSLPHTNTDAQRGHVDSLRTGNFGQLTLAKGVSGF